MVGFFEPPDWAACASGDEARIAKSASAAAKTATIEPLRFWVIGIAFSLVGPWGRCMERSCSAAAAVSSVGRLRRRLHGARSPDERRRDNRAMAGERSDERESGGWDVIEAAVDAAEGGGQGPGA